MGVKDEITYNEDFYNWAVKTVPVYGFGSETVNWSDPEQQCMKTLSCFTHKTRGGGGGGGGMDSQQYPVQSNSIQSSQHQVQLKFD